MPYKQHPLNLIKEGEAGVATRHNAIVLVFWLLGPEQRVFYYYDKMSLESIDKIVTRLIADWNAVCQLFAAVVEFSEVYNSG